MSYSMNPSRNFRAWISSACRRLCNAAPFVVAALALVVLAAPAQAQVTRTALDADGDGLIEVETLAQLNAIRWDLDGNGEVDNSGAQNDYNTAFFTNASGSTCTNCEGYELTTDLDFDTDGDGATHTSGTGDADDAYYNSGSGWDPIGLFDNTGPVDPHPYTATFEGNRHTISNLFISRSTGGDDNQGFGLFAYTSSTSEIRNVGLVNVHVTGRANTGSLVGRVEGRVYASYATGSVTGTGTVGGLVAHLRENPESVIAASYANVAVTATSTLGGLVGLNAGGTIIASYSTGAVHCSASGCTAARGGLVGSHRVEGSSAGSIIASYSTGAVTPTGTSGAGGLIGDIRTGTTVTNSYWDITNSGIADDTDTNSPEGKTESALQTPRGYSGIYSAWNVDVDNADNDNNPSTGGDSPWNFGRTSDYPALWTAVGGVTMVFGPQGAPRTPALTVALAQDTGGNNIIQVSLTRNAFGGGEPTGYQYRYDVGDSRPTAWDDDNPTWIDGATFSITPATGETIYYIEVRATNAHADSPGPVASYTMSLADFPDNDSDGDNLIEVTNLDQLNAIRYDLDGNGHVDDPADAVLYSAYFRNISCAGATPNVSTCTGYELFATPFSDTPTDSRGLDFHDPNSYASGSIRPHWTSAGVDGWRPIGDDTNVIGLTGGDFTGEFQGNGYAISNLFIDRDTTDDVGLFARIGTGGLVQNLALKEVKVTGQMNTGGLAGTNAGTIQWVYVTGTVTGDGGTGGLVGHQNGDGLTAEPRVAASYSTVTVDTSGGSGNNTGGLVGLNNVGDIIASYATGNVTGSTNSVGGLVGSHHNSASAIIASYATGTVTASGATPGGLVGDVQSGTITNSYWDTATSTITTGSNGTGQTTSALQSPTGYTGIYANWDVDVDGVSGNDDPWEFGGPGDYPKLKADFNHDGTPTAIEFGPQHGPLPPHVAIPPTHPVAHSHTSTPVPTDTTDTAAQAALTATPPSGTLFTTGGLIYDITVQDNMGAAITDTLTTPVQVCLPIPAGVNRADAYLYRYDAGEWVRETRRRTVEERLEGVFQVCADVLHFSFFQVGKYTQQGSGGGDGGGGGGGGGGSRDQHGNTPAQATTLAFSPASPRRATAAGQISPAGDIDYFTVTLPRAGLLVVETTGRTDTAGTVWQHDQELADAILGGERRNFRLSTPVTAGPVVIAVTGNGNRTGAYTLVVRLVVGYFENPQPGSAQSGIGVLSGWVCEADTVVIEFDRPDGSVQQLPAALGTSRTDTEAVCGQSDTGFGLLWNWNRLGDGEHTVRALVDGEVFAEHTLTVTTLGLGEFPEGLSGTYALMDFPTQGETTGLQWSQAQQNFVIGAGDGATGGATSDPSQARLENPQPGSFQSGVGVISGWVCEAEEVEIVFENGTTGETLSLPAGYGTSRTDTQEVCGDSDNGFGLLWNWNKLGPGEHVVRAFVDGEEMGWARLWVTTLDEEFRRGLAGQYTLPDFPAEGQTVTVEWQEALQNFTITGRQ